MAGEKIIRDYVTKKNYKLIKNFSSLTLLQVSNYLFPLITFPYLVRVLGVENFGTANFVLAFIAYFVTITDYGFRFSATQQISVSKNNPKQLELIFNSTIVIKLIISVIAFFLFLIIILSFEKFNQNVLIYLSAFLFVVGSVFYVDWFFQGIEKMEYLAYVQIPLRILSVAAIFLFVKTESDLSKYIIIISLSQLCIGICLYLAAKIAFKILFVRPTTKHLLDQLKAGYHIFLSQISINLYTSSNVFLLGLLSGNIAVGYFTGANKIKDILHGIFSNMGTTAFPHFADLLSKSRVEGVKTLKKYLGLVSITSLLMGILVFIFSEKIVMIILGNDYSNSIEVLKILSFLPFIIVLSNVLGIQIMLNLGYAKEFNRIIAFAALLNIILMFLLVPIFNEQGAALSMLIVEIFVTLTMTYFVLNRKLLK